MFKKNIFKAIISSIVLVLAILLLVGCGSKNKKITTEPTNTTNNNNNNNNFLTTARSIKVVQISGAASVTDTEETTKCFAGMNLYDGDTLTVSKDSTLVIKFDDDKYVYLGENTTISIKSEGKDKYKTNIFVTGGTILAEVQKKLDEDEEFFLSSNNSVMAVRGTVFGLNVETKGDNIVQTYAVYRGVTELYVFDKLNDTLISGKISDITDAKYELTIPRDHIINKDEINNAVGEWLDKGASTFDDANDANNKLDEVAITVSKPTRADFEKVINVVETDINYTDIEYTTQGYFGEYDGNAHKITVTPTTPGATVKYSLDGVNYQTDNTFEFYSPGSYRVYYKIECEGHDTKEDFEVIYITKPNIIVISDNISYDSTSNMSVINISTLNDDDFNRFNGVKVSTVFANQKFYINETEVVANNITVNYNKLIDGYIELVDGKNTLNVSFEFDDFTLDTEVYFLFSDTREDIGYSVAASIDEIELLSGNMYLFDSSYAGLTQSGDDYEIAGNDLLTSFGLDVLDLSTMLINYPQDTLGSNTNLYDGNNTITIASETYASINFLVFPTSTTKGFNETIYVYISTSGATPIYPTYSINRTTYAYNPTTSPSGVLMDFVTSNKQVVYSTDNTNYTNELYLTEGTYKVYYKVKTFDNNADLDIVGYEYINIYTGKGEITFDNKMFITNPVHILSNDGRDIYWKYNTTENYYYDGYVTATNNETITSLDDAYTVYSNLIKNSVFYDSISKDVINATVTISEKQANSASFNYTIEAEGYDTVSGTVRFENSDLTGLANLSSNPDSDSFTVTLPIDYEISLSEVPQAIPSRISFTLEDEFINYETYYSADNGKTWSKTAPKLTTVGEHDVYVLYCFVDNGNDATTLVDGELTGTRHSNLSASGNFIIDIAHITITE